MPKYRVTCVKPVQDYLRCFVDVEADTPEDAEDKALEIASEQDLYVFWQCGDSLEETTAEAEEIKEAT